MKKRNVIFLLSALVLASCGSGGGTTSSETPSSSQESSRASEASSSSVEQTSAEESSRAPEESSAPSPSTESSSELPSSLPEESSSEEESSEAEVSSALESSSEPSSSIVESSSEEEDVIKLDDPEIVDNDYKGVVTTDACYEIFVYSFCDSNGDGIGDLKGIQSKLDYLHDLGVRNLWLTPVHPSSTNHKYNVRDYYGIDSSFGTVKDFENLCADAKAKGMGIFMDMVFNHSGLDNPLFTQAISDYLSGKTGNDSLADLYVLSTNDKEVPNTKSSYYYNGTKIWYECNFDSSMPEFNTKGKSAPNLHEDIMRYWIGKGASGFRFDGVAYYDYSSAKNSMAYVKTLSTLARSIKSDVYLVAEYWKSSQSQINGVAENGMTCFNFPTSDTVSNSVLNGVRGGRGYKFAKTLASADEGFRAASDSKILPAFFISNHDQDRWAKNLSDLQFRQVVASYLFTPGTPFLYYGEEIGLLGTRQVAATDANRRLPMQWTTPIDQDKQRPTAILRESDYSGNQTTLGALEAIEDPDSITSWYKEVLHFRLDHPEISKGTYTCLVSDKYSPLAAFRIRYEGKSYYLIHNFESEAPVKVALPEDAVRVEGFQIGEVAQTGRILDMSPSSSILLEAA